MKVPRTREPACWEASSLKDKEDPVTRRTREASMARATKKREIVSKKREATTTRNRELELEQPPTYHPDVGLTNVTIEEQPGEDEEMKAVSPPPPRNGPKKPSPNPAPPTKKEVPRTLLQTKSPKPAQAAPTTATRSPRMVRIFDQPAS